MVAGLDTGAPEVHDLGMNQFRAPGLFGPGVPRWWWRWTPRGRRKMVEIHADFAAQARGWEVHGLPVEFGTMSTQRCRRTAERHEALVRLWSGPLRRVVLGH